MTISTRLAWFRFQRRSWAALAIAFIVCGVSRADDAADVQALLNANTAPHGVVFEVASNDANGLVWAMPRVQRYVGALRERFPGLEIALVTHGREQFALTTQHLADRPALQNQIQQLVREQDVPVHVCETYAERNGVGAEQFPADVQVAAAGPAQVQAYRELGYTVIRLRPSKRFD